MEMNPKDAQHMAQVVMAGMKLMYDKTTSKMLTKGITRKNVPLPKRLAMETAGLMKLLMDRSQNKIPKQILIPAALTLMVEMAKFMADAGVEKPTKQDMDAAKDALVIIMKRLFGGPPGPQQAPAAPQAPAPAPAAPAPEQQGGLMMQGA
jgi:hypothetical protein